MFAAKGKCGDGQKCGQIGQKCFHKNAQVFRLVVPFPKHHLYCMRRIFLKFLIAMNITYEKLMVQYLKYQGQTNMQTNTNVSIKIRNKFAA